MEDLLRDEINRPFKILSKNLKQLTRKKEDIWSKRSSCNDQIIAEKITFQRTKMKYSKLRPRNRIVTISP